MSVEHPARWKKSDFLQHPIPFSTWKRSGGLCPLKDRTAEFTDQRWLCLRYRKAKMVMWYALPCLRQG
eukprot:1554535-Lingulodinium_polyedra.AAC.1